MKKILLALLLSPLSLFAQESPYIIQKSDFIVLKNPAVVGGGGGASTFDAIGSGTNTTATMTCGTGCTIGASGSGTITATAVAVGGITGLGAGVAAWLATASCANFATAVSGETGTCGSIVLSTGPTLTGPLIDNGATSAGYFRILEDSDNGSNYVQVNGQDSLSANYNVRVPSNLPEVDQTVELGWGSGEDQIYAHDEMLCGAAAAATAGPGCLNWMWSHTSATWGGTPSGGSSGANNGLPPGYARGTLDATNDVLDVAGQNKQSLLMMDGYRMRTRVRTGGASTTAAQYVIYVGGHEATGANTTAPAHGAFFSYTNTDANGTPNWTINLESASADCGILSGPGTPAGPTNWVKLELKYKASDGVHFYVDGVECSNSPMNADPPTSPGEEFSWFNFKAVSIAGAGGPTFDIDYVTLGPTPFAR